MGNIRKLINATLKIKDILRSYKPLINDDTFILNKSKLDAHKLY